MTSSEIQKPRALKRLLILLHAGFFLVGVVAVLLGQILPVLIKRLTLDDRAAGYLFVWQFAGSLLGTLFYNRIIGKFGYLKLLSGGFCLTALGCAGLNFDSLPATAAAIFTYGVGIGAAIPAINLLIVELNPQKSAAALSLINFFWGAGAILCKPFVDFAAAPGDIAAPTRLMGLFLLTTAAALAILDFQRPFKIEAEKNKNASNSGSVPIWTTPAARLIALFGFIHVGVESSVGGWITTFETRLNGTAHSTSLSAAFVFFLLLVAGRAAAPLFFRFLSENAVLLGGLFMMTAGIIFVLTAADTAFLLTGTALLGFGSSSIFPTNLSRFTRFFGADSLKNAAPLFVFGSLGGASATWLVGFISAACDNLRAGFSVVLVSCLILVVLQILLARITTNQSTTAA